MPLGDALKAALSGIIRSIRCATTTASSRAWSAARTCSPSRAIEISAQAGKMVGVEKEERLATR